MKRFFVLLWMLILFSHPLRSEDSQGYDGAVFLNSQRVEKLFHDNGDGTWSEVIYPSTSGTNTVTGTLTLSGTSPVSIPSGVVVNSGTMTLTGTSPVSIPSGVVVNSGTMTLTGSARTAITQTITSGTAATSGTFNSIKSLGVAMKTGTLYLIGSSGTASLIAGSETAAYYQSFAPDTATFTYSLLTSSTATIINTQ